MTVPRLTLPKPRISGPMSLEEVINQRRSVRRFTPEVLTLEEIGQLLWSAQGITGERDTQRAAPSAGGRHPLVFYVCRADGMWRYHPSGHFLSRHIGLDVRDDLVEAAWRQNFIAEAPCVIIISAVFKRTTERYKDRGGQRYVPMDAGHAAENLLLQAIALGLGGVPVAAFNDGPTKHVLALPDNEDPLYIIPVGHPKGG